MKGMGGKGADIEAVAIVIGVEEKLVRKCVAFQGDLSLWDGRSVYDALDKKATRQAINADIREIQLEITDKAMSSVQNWREVIKRKLESFHPIHPDVTVHGVGSAGNDLYF